MRRAADGHIDAVTFDTTEESAAVFKWFVPPAGFVAIHLTGRDGTAFVGDKRVDPAELASFLQERLPLTANYFLVMCDAFAQPDPFAVALHSADKRLNGGGRRIVGADGTMWIRVADHPDLGAAIVTGLDITGDGRTRLRLSPEGLPPRTFLEVSNDGIGAESRGEVHPPGMARDVSGQWVHRGDERPWSLPGGRPPAPSTTLDLDPASASVVQRVHGGPREVLGTLAPGPTPPPDWALEPVSWAELSGGRLAGDASQSAATAAAVTAVTGRGSGADRARDSLTLRPIRPGAGQRGRTPTVRVDPGGCAEALHTGVPTDGQFLAAVASHGGPMDRWSGGHLLRVRVPAGGAVASTPPVGSSCCHRLAGPGSRDHRRTRRSRTRARRTGRQRTPGTVRSAAERSGR